MNEKSPGGKATTTNITKYPKDFTESTISRVLLC